MPFMMSEVSYKHSGYHRVNHESRCQSRREEEEHGVLGIAVDKQMSLTKKQDIDKDSDRDRD